MPLPHTLHRIITVPAEPPVRRRVRPTLSQNQPSGPPEPPMRSAVRELLRERLLDATPDIDPLELALWASWEFARIDRQEDMTLQDWQLIDRAAEIVLGELLEAGIWSPSEEVAA